MKRTIKPGNANGIMLNKAIHTLASQILGRAELSVRLGTDTYGGARDIYQALGYPKDLNFGDYYSRYKRQDIAKAVIDRPVKATWQGTLEMIESDDAEETPFEEAWEELDWKFGIKSKLSRVDKLTGIGQYGILFLGLDDGKSRDALALPVKPGIRTLKYIKPYSEKTAQILTYETNPKNERYGLPVLYTISTNDPNGVISTIQVHHTRIVHIVDDPLESEVAGPPRLEAIYNRLVDIEKLAGGDAEMFWRGARPGYTGKLDKDYQMTKETEDNLEDQINEFEHNLRRILVNEGIDLKELAQQIADPANHMDIQFALISCLTGIPKRVLSGSEQGELASTQDTNQWLTYVKIRREEHAEPRIIRPFVDRLIELGVLPTPEEGSYRVKWSDLFAVSEKSKVEIGKGRANALREYTYNPIASEMIPLNAFLEYFLGFDKSQIEIVTKMREEAINDETQDFTKIIAEATAAAQAAKNPQAAKPAAKKPIVNRFKRTK